MSTAPDRDATPWQFVPLPTVHLHPLTYLRPDVVLHVHDLWQAGTHGARTVRSFSLYDVSKVEPFVMTGLTACLDFVAAWKVEAEDVTLLQGVESLSHLSPEFWEYLLSLKGFSGSITGMPEGTVMGMVPITVTPELQEMFGDKPVPLDLIKVDGKSAEVALVSEGLAAILDFSICYSRNLLADKNAAIPPTFYESEREIHPFWARLAGTIEYVLGVQHPLATSLDRLWLWVDDERDAVLRARASDAGATIQRGGREVTLLIKREMIGRRR